MVPPSPANFYFPASGVLKITLRPCLRPPRPRRVVVVVDCTWWGCIVTGEGLIPPTGMYSSKKKRIRGKSVGMSEKMRTAHEERDEDRASTPQGPMGPSVRSFLFLPLSRFSLRRGSLLTEERDILLLSLIPRRRVRIRFSRQIPCLQAAATSLFGINLPILHPVSGTSCNRISLSARLGSLLPAPANDSRSYDFLSLINYRVARGVCRDLERLPFFRPPPDSSTCVLRFSAQRRVATAENDAANCERALGRARFRE